MTIADLFQLQERILEQDGEAEGMEVTLPWRAFRRISYDCAAMCLTGPSISRIRLFGPGGYIVVRRAARTTQDPCDWCGSKSTEKNGRCGYCGAPSL